MDTFSKCKASILSNFLQGIDYSTKGSIDAPVLHLVKFINILDEYVTTSSCSGRISCYVDMERTKGVRWIHVTHGFTTFEDVKAAVTAVEESDALIVLKCEPLILHVQCRSVEDARRLHEVAMSSGYRESGIGIGQKKIMVAIRTTSYGLEMPIAKGNKLLLSDDVLEMMVREANYRLHCNFARMDKLYTSLKKTFHWPTFNSVPTSMTCARWGHAVVPCDEGLLCVGGFGVDDKGQATRSLPSCFLTSTSVVSSMCPLTNTQHACIAKHNSQVLLVGGRASPKAGLPMLRVFDAQSMVELDITCTGDLPAPRWGHTLTELNDSQFLLFGGRNDVEIFNDMYVVDSIDVLTWKFEKIELFAGPLTAVCFHAAARIEDNVVMIYGGITSLEEDRATGQCVVVARTASGWIAETVIGHPEQAPRFAHTLTRIDKRTFVVVGGSTFEPSPLSYITLIHLQGNSNYDCNPAIYHAICSDVPVTSPCGEVNCRCHHQTVYNTEKKELLIIGGGLPCFSFNPHYCPPHLLSLGYTDVTAPSSHTDAAAPVKKQNAIAATPQKVEEKVVLLVPKQLVKKVKVYLETKEWLDKDTRITAAQLTDTSHVNIVTSSTEVVIDTYDGEENWLMFMAVPLKQQAVDILRSDVSEVDALTQIVKTLYLQKQSCLSKKDGISPYQCAVCLVNDILASLSLPSTDVETLKKDIPAKFELVGDILLIPEGYLCDERWPSEIWPQLATVYSCTRIARKAEIDSGAMRESKVRLLWPTVGRPDVTGPGSAGWVQVIENGIKFSFDLTRVMFCSGNVTERMRMGTVAATGQTIVDLYAGVGYYTLPFLVHANADFVHACEWNPNSILSLKNNLQSNGVAPSRYAIHEGDNKNSIDKVRAVADRVCLGLLPSSVSGWPLAVSALKKTGGIIHVHENVVKKEINPWVGNACVEFERLFRDEVGVTMRVLCTHVEVVKSYAPRIVHIVADLKCTPVLEAVA